MSTKLDDLIKFFLFSTLRESAPVIGLFFLGSKVLPLQKSLIYAGKNNVALELRDSNKKFKNLLISKKFFFFL